LASRVEVRLAATVAASTALLMAVVLVTFAMLTRHEALEELSAGLRRELRGVRGTKAEVLGVRLAEVAPLLEAQGISLRVIDPGKPAREFGKPWPLEEDSYRGPLGSLTAFRVQSHEFLVRSLLDDRGATIEVAAPLRHFVRERVEMNRILLATLLGGCALASAVAAALARRSLEPLRAATVAIDRVDQDHLDARLPVRGTDDLVDRHAQAVNQVLARLAWAFARIRAFSADVAHELRTPVNRMLNLSELAALESAGDGERADALARLQESALAMSRLIDSLLLLASGEEGRLRVRLARVDLAELATRMCDLFRPACEERAIRLSVELGAAQVQADEQLLSQCLSNLMDNALRHSPAGKPLRVSVARTASGAAIRVEDSGLGVPPEQRERVFDRFVQLDPARSSGHVGLGLPIARMIARVHHGDLIASDSELGGAAFEITLPA
jgi:signal transduction histidine kinase